jgi:threonine dehydrogenase-like Zn-dependent dehydrogenase
MKALRFHGVKYLRVEEVPGPKACGAHQVLVQNSYCGICGTDLHEYLHGPIQIPQKSHLFSKSVLPLILGYEFSGVVVETGSEVQDVRVGDRVSIQPNVIPGGDYYGRRGWSHLSDNLSVVGLSYPWGGMAEQCDFKTGDSILITGGDPSERWSLRHLASERGYTPCYKHLEIAKPGEGGGMEQVGFHGLEPESLVTAVQELAR